MRVLCLSLCVAGLVVMTGCNNTTTGGPGATPTNATADNTFNLELPSTTTSLHQGEKKEVTITIKAGKAFNQEVPLKFTLPEGIRIEPASPVIKQGEKDIKVMVEATDTAPEGTREITVNAAPHSGTPGTGKFKVDVTKK